MRSAHEAAELSRETGKPIMVYVRSETCHFCDLMQSDVWEDSKVAQIVMRQYVPLKLTREENPEAVAAMKIKGFPATLLFSSDYAYIGRLDGYMKSAPFLQAISKMGTVASNDPSRWR